MKTLLALLVIFVLILGTPQTNAERVSLEDRRLLSDANLGRKVNGGVNDKDLTAVNKVAEATENGNTCTEVDNNNDETNQSYGNYGEDGSSTDSHHYFHDKDLTAGNKVAEATENGNTCTEVDNNNDETNQSYGNYGEDGSSTDSHHYFQTDNDPSAATPKKASNSGR